MREAERLARTWIEAWNAGDPSLIPLAEDFEHSSPFGTISGKRAYLEFMKPMTGGKGPTLEVLHTLTAGDECAIWFEMDAPGGRIPVCDWVRVRDGKIVAIQSFYDASKLR